MKSGAWSPGSSMAGNLSRPKLVELVRQLRALEIADVRHSELLAHALRPDVVDQGEGDDARQAGACEAPVDRGPRGLGGEPLAPAARRDRPARLDHRLVLDLVAV